MDLEEEFKKEMASLRLEFGNEHHLQIAEKLKMIAKYSKGKRGPKTTEDINNLKKSILYLIKMDF